MIEDTDTLSLHDALPISMFLVKDQDKADNELDSYGINLNLAIESFLKGNFEDAISYHENVIQSLYELNKIKNNKRIHDKVQFILDRKSTRLNSSHVKISY